MARKAKEEQYYKTEISQAANQLFLEKGLDKTTMDDIARKAEYSKATLYVYFKNKEDIYYYIVLQSMHELYGRLEKTMLEHKGAVQQYFALCEEMAGFAEEYPFYFESILDTIDTAPESRAMLPVLEEIYLAGEEANGMVQQLLQRGIEQGIFRKNLPSLETGFIQWAALAGIVRMANKKQRYIKQRMGLDKKQFLQFGFEMMLRSVLAEDKGEQDG